MKRIIGRCSCCGGNVTLPTYWMSVVPPVPSCERCGAVQKNTLPVIEMERPRRSMIAARQLGQFVKDELEPHTEKVMDGVSKCLSWMEP